MKEKFLIVTQESNGFGAKLIGLYGDIFYQSERDAFASLLRVVPTGLTLTEIMEQFSILGVPDGLTLKEVIVEIDKVNVAALAAKCNCSDCQRNRALKNLRDPVDEIPAKENSDEKLDKLLDALIDIGVEVINDILGKKNGQRRDG